MQATEILRKEHDVILKMLDAADALGGRMVAGQTVDRAILKGLLEFFQLFADRCHHGKEEELLFPLLEKKGMPRGGGPIGVMLYEHESGRELIREMESASSHFGDNPSESARRWVQAAGEYANLLREHIAKENNVLFRMAESMLSAGEQEQLAREFERMEVDKMGAGTHERLHKQMEKLVAEIAKPQAAHS